jgi:hypothetical protein
MLEELSKEQVEVRQSEVGAAAVKMDRAYL